LSKDERVDSTLAFGIEALLPYALGGIAVLAVVAGVLTVFRSQMRRLLAAVSSSGSARDGLVRVSIAFAVTPVSYTHLTLPTN
jgi:hypothetical protein